MVFPILDSNFTTKTFPPVDTILTDADIDDEYPANNNNFNCSFNTEAKIATVQIDACVNTHSINVPSMSFKKMS